MKPERGWISLFGTRAAWWYWPVILFWEWPRNYIANRGWEREKL